MINGEGGFSRSRLPRFFWKPQDICCKKGIAMFKTLPAGLPLLAAVALGPALAIDGVASGQNQSTSTETQAAGMRAERPKSTKGVLAMVNGTPITEADVRLALSVGGHSKDIPSEHRKNVLGVIVRRELIRQRAVALRLDVNPTYQEKLRRMEARINAFKRQELSELFWRETARKVEVSEAEAKKYFAENAARIRTDLHVWQILLRKEGLAELALNDLQQGKPFEEVAGRRFPKMPKTARAPWDLGHLKWKQVPKSWRNVVYDMKKGEVSSVIRGPNNRFWIIKLIDKRENPDITLESIKPTIMEVLKNAKIEDLRAQIDRDLRAKATIVYSNRPVGSSEE
jgi:parvulin-like peptidyl-prolyl isomerase